MCKCQSTGTYSVEVIISNPHKYSANDNKLIQSVNFVIHRHHRDIFCEHSHSHCTHTVIKPNNYCIAQYKTVCYPYYVRSSRATALLCQITFCIAPTNILKHFVPSYTIHTYKYLTGVYSQFAKCLALTPRLCVCVYVWISAVQWRQFTARSPVFRVPSVHHLRLLFARAWAAYCLSTF